MELTNARVQTLFRPVPSNAGKHRIEALLRRLGHVLTRAYGAHAQALSLYR